MGLYSTFLCLHQKVSLPIGGIDEFEMSSLVISCLEYNALLLLSLFCHKHLYSNLFIFSSANRGKSMDCITYTSCLTRNVFATIPFSLYAQTSFAPVFYYRLQSLEFIQLFSVSFAILSFSKYIPRIFISSTTLKGRFSCSLWEHIYSASFFFSSLMFGLSPVNPSNSFSIVKEMFISCSFLRNKVESSASCLI